MPSIRPATDDDCDAIADIYRHYVENSVATFDLDSMTVDEWRVKLASIIESGRPFLVVESDDGSHDVLGYAYLGVYRGKAGWNWTAEDSIYLRPEAAGRGIGSRLLRELLDAADPAVTRTVMAVISDEVPESVALHRKVGFVEVGRSPGVGRKFDRWIGCVYLQYTIGD
ncbi:GNAT family N-acetyltransferase [Gordonia neofelifaecis]|uniref:Sortase n=1 Tax=Gordonia neofelifaecis NRRL B-59395 TaxID=644548 RepID=F1YPT3_9ACTN|nr:GNAT family N-acetyltransferase [Gordonia neofelifaecis]EGD53303.1 sortase [Gordonia neofelifaecis NRRL B-59395]